MPFCLLFLTQQRTGLLCAPKNCYGTLTGSVDDLIFLFILLTHLLSNFFSARSSSIKSLVKFSEKLPKKRTSLLTLVWHILTFHHPSPKECLFAMRTVVAFGGERKELDRFGAALVQARRGGVNLARMEGRNFMEVGDECCLSFLCVFFVGSIIIGHTHIFLGLIWWDFRVFQPVFGLFLVVFFFCVSWTQGGFRHRFSYPHLQGSRDPGLDGGQWMDSG